MVKSHFRVCIVLMVARSHSRLYYFFFIYWPYYEVRDLGSSNEFVTQVVRITENLKMTTV